MDIAILIVEALKFIFPAYCANAVPVIAGGGTPMDFGKNFFDGKPILGKNKTFQGFFSGLIIGTTAGLVFSLTPSLNFLTLLSESLLSDIFFPRD